MSVHDFLHNAAMERDNVGATVSGERCDGGEWAGVPPILEGSALEAPAEVWVPTQQRPTDVAPCEGERLLEKPSTFARVHVIVCVERGSVMAVLSRWSVSSANVVGTCEGEELAGLAHLERVVKTERERRGL